MEFSTKLPWWRTDTYDIDSPTLPAFAGPHGVATVRVFGEITQPGWGLAERPAKDGKPAVPGFMWQYSHKQFNSRITAHRYRTLGEPFAYVMRSMRLICIDIDGKNGGFENTPQLGPLPETLAETSKSGNGYHLFYSTDEAWDDVEGFALYADHIGIATGIDIRATGCVYHHSTQRWNNRSIAPVPDFLADLLRKKKERREVAHATAAQVKEMDMDDMLLAHHELETELAKSIPPGKRNNTLFAIGSKMRAAGVPAWDEKVRARGVEIGLDQDELDKLLDNIAAYGD